MRRVLRDFPCGGEVGGDLVRLRGMLAPATTENSCNLAIKMEID
jgi:hypothetical protein